MLYFSRWKTAAITGTALVVSLAALTNVLPAPVFNKLPAWAQRKIVLGIDLQGGARYQLVIDKEYLRKEQVDRLFEDVRHFLRQSQIGHGGLAKRDGAIEVRVREPIELPKVLSRLNEFLGPLEALPRRHSSYSVGRTDEKSLTARWDAYVPRPDVDIAVEGQLIRLTLTGAAVSQRIKQGREKSIDVVSRRVQAGGTRFTVQPVGSDRLVVEVFDPEERWRLVQY